MFRVVLALLFLLCIIGIETEAQFRNIGFYGGYGPAWRRRLWQETSPFDGEHEIRTRLARF